MRKFSEQNIESSSSSRGCAQVEDEKGANRRDVNAANRRHDAAEEVEVDIRGCEDWPEQSDALCLGKPGEEDTDGDQARVEGEEIDAALDNNDCETTWQA